MSAENVKAELPAPYRRGGRLYFDRHEFENFKRQMIGLAPLERDPSKPIEFIPAPQAATELPYGRRTLGRLVRGRERRFVEGA